MAMPLIRGLANQTKSILAKRMVSSKITSPTVKSAVEEMKSSWHQNLKRQRPVSPYHYHLFNIMRLTSTTSITHRMTGAAMAMVVPAFGTFYFFRPSFDLHGLLDRLRNYPIGVPVKFVVAFPLVYHYVNGCRHLSWDWARGFALPTIRKTGLGAMGFTAAFCIGMAFLRLDKEAVLAKKTDDH